MLYLDEILFKDSNAHVACENAITKELVRIIKDNFDFRPKFII